MVTHILFYGLIFFAFFIYKNTNEEKKKGIFLYHYYNFILKYIHTFNYLLSFTITTDCN